MTEKSKPVTVKILEKEYKIGCPPGEHEVLRQSAMEVDRRMRAIRKTGKVLNSDRVAVMVALNLAHELLGAQTQVNNIDGSVLERLEAIQSRITETLKVVNE